MDHLASEPASIIIGHPTAEAAEADRKECALVMLRGATERLLMILDYRSARNYEQAMQAVERKIAEYRATIEAAQPLTNNLTCAAAYSAGSCPKP